MTQKRYVTLASILSKIGDNYLPSYVILFFFYHISLAIQITVSFDETTTLEDVDTLFKVFSGGKAVSVRSGRKNYSKF